MTTSEGTDIFYGRIPVSTGIAPGSYTDSLTVTVTYTGISLCL